MTRSAFLLTAVVMFLAMTGGAFAARPCSNYDFVFHAQPAFHPESTVSLRIRRGSPELTIAYGDIRTRVPKTERLTFSGPASERLCSRMLELMKVNPKKDDRHLYDGISVSGSFRIMDSKNYTFSFRSPDKLEYPRDYGIADAVFTLFESTAVSCELNEYLEQLATYFSFGLPARIISGVPYTVRLYGALSINHEAAVAHLLSSLPTDTQIQFDITNFYGMGTLLYPQFRKLLTRFPAISWTASAHSAKMLAEIGVKSETLK
jgi:hypothetical protein